MSMQSVLRPTSIVVAVDSSDFAAGVVEAALDHASRLQAVDLHFLRVLASRGSSRRDRHGEAEAAHEAVGALIHEALVNLGGLSDRSGWTVRVHALLGDPAEEILGLAADVEADLIVLGRWGNQTPHRDRLGSIAESIVAGASCPVLVHQPSDYETAQRPEACADCVAIRRETRGERWFCSTHASDRTFRTTTVIAAAFTPTGGASQF